MKNNLLDALEKYKKIDKEKQIPKEPIKNENKLLNILLWIFSLCSVIFGASVIKAMPTIELDSIMGISIAIFIIFILFVNEIVKVKTISALYESFTDNKNFYNLFIALVCIGLSASSIYGIFVNLDSNKPVSEVTIVAEDSTSVKLEREIESLESANNESNIVANLKKSELTKSDFESLSKLRKKSNKSDEDIELEKELKLKLDNLVKEEQLKLKEKIEFKKQELKVHKESLVSNSNSKQSKGSVVVFILLAIVIIVESGIVTISYIQGKDAYVYNKKYIAYIEQVELIEKQKKEELENNKLTIQFRKYLPIIENLYLLDPLTISKKFLQEISQLSQKESDTLYGLLKNLGILSDGTSNVKLDVSKEKAIDLLNGYYSEQLKDLL